MRDITKEIRVSYDDVLKTLLVPLGGWLLGEIIAVSVAVSTSEGMFISMGSLFAYIATAIIMLILPLTQVLINFDIAVSMGRTRKKYLAGITLVLLVEIVGMLAVATLLSGISYTVKTMFFSDVPFTNVFSVFTHEFVSRFWYVVPTIPVVFVIFAFIVSALVKKFTAKVLWVFWAVYMVAIFTVTSSASRRVNLTDTPVIATIINALALIPPYIYIILAIAFVALSLVLSIKYLLKASVT